VVEGVVEEDLLSGDRTSQAVEGVAAAAGDPIQPPVALWKASQDWGLLEVVVPWQPASYAVAPRMLCLHQRHRQPH